MDIFSYVVLHAHIENLATVIKFVRTFANPELLTTELGYYFSALELSMEYILTLR